MQLAPRPGLRPGLGAGLRKLRQYSFPAVSNIELFFGIAIWSVFVFVLGTCGFAAMAAEEIAAYGHRLQHRHKLAV